jgi:hypothetical protein
MPPRPRHASSAPPRARSTRCSDAADHRRIAWRRRARGPLRASLRSFLPLTKRAVGSSLLAVLSPLTKPLSPAPLGLLGPGHSDLLPRGDAVPTLLRQVGHRKSGAGELKRRHYPRGDHPSIAQLVAPPDGGLSTPDGVRPSALTAAAGFAAGLGRFRLRRECEGLAPPRAHHGHTGSKPPGSRWSPSRPRTTLTSGAPPRSAGQQTLQMHRTQELGSATEFFRPRERRGNERPARTSDALTRADPRPRRRAESPPAANHAVGPNPRG